MNEKPHYCELMIVAAGDVYADEFGRARKGKLRALVESLVNCLDEKGEYIGEKYEERAAVAIGWLLDGEYPTPPRDWMVAALMAEGSVLDYCQENRPRVHAQTR